MLDDRFDERLAELERLFASADGPRRQAERAGEDFTRAVAADEQWRRLFLELAVHAAGDPTFHAALQARYRAMKARIAEIIERYARDGGVELPRPPAETAVMAFAMAHGVALEAMLDADAVDDDLLGRMFALLAPAEPSA